LPVLKAEKTGPVTQENNASAFFGAANAMNTMNFLDIMLCTRRCGRDIHIWLRFTIREP
jgi:hypothetical protein